MQRQREAGAAVAVPRRSRSRSEAPYAEEMAGRRRSFIRSATDAAGLRPQSAVADHIRRQGAMTPYYLPFTGTAMKPLLSAKPTTTPELSMPSAVVLVAPGTLTNS